MKIFEALYNSCIHESSYGTLSLHKTKKGAEEVIRKHRLKTKENFDNMVNHQDQKFSQLWEGMKYDDHQDWMVIETELLD